MAISIIKKQHSVNMKSNEIIELRDCSAVQNCSNTHILYSFEPFGNENIGAPLIPLQLLYMPIGITTVYLKSSNKLVHIEAFGVSL